MTMVGKVGGMWLMAFQLRIQGQLLHETTVSTDVVFMLLTISCSYQHEPTGLHGADLC